MSYFYARDGAPMPLGPWMQDRTDPRRTTLAVTILDEPQRLVTVWTGVDLALCSESAPVGAPLCPFLTFIHAPGMVPQPVAMWETEQQATDGHNSLAKAIKAGETFRTPSPATPQRHHRDEEAALAMLDQMRHGKRT